MRDLIRFMESAGCNTEPCIEAHRFGGLVRIDMMVVSRDGTENRDWPRLLRKMGKMPFVEGNGLGSTSKMEHEFVGLPWDVECGGGCCPKVYKSDNANTDRRLAFLRQSARLAVNTAVIARLHEGYALIC